MLALACMDGLLSLWLSSHPVPIFVLKDLVDENAFITDIAWTADGSALVYSSSQGVASISLAWGKILPGLSPWSLAEVLQWRSRKHLQVTQPFWDLPTSIHSLEAWDSAVESGTRRSRYFVEDGKLRGALQGLDWSQDPKDSKGSRAFQVIDVNSCCERQKLLKSWHSKLGKPRVPAPPAFTWSVEDLVLLKRSRYENNGS